MNLVLDIGNTRTKAAVFENNHIVEHLILEKNPLPQLKKLLHSFPDIKFSLVSSVLNHSKEIVNSLQHKTNCIHFDLNSKIPLHLDYKTPETLGKDRLAAAVGAYTLFPGKNVLIIDAGTCLKIDLVTSQRIYKGGAISPGLHMRLKALNVFTDKLPHCEPEPEFTALNGQSTRESIISGVQNGMLFEINGFISAWKQQYSDLQVVLSGGDQTFFEVALKNSIFAHPNLVLIGLNEILKLNVS